MEEQDMPAQAAKIERLLEEIEHLPDPAVRAKVVEIVQALLALYGGGLARLLALVAQENEPATAAKTLAAFADDALLAPLLALHDLHPTDLTTRVERALEEVRPYLQSHGGNVQLIGVEAGVAHLQLQGHCKGCPSSTMTLKHTVEEAIYRAAPELAGIAVEEPEAAETPPANFVPISALFASSK